MNLMPLYDKIVVKIDSKQELRSTTGLVCVRDMSKSNNTVLIATVVAVGEGRLLADGHVLPMKVKVGDRVMYSKMQGESFNDGEDDYTILSEQNIMAIVHDKSEGDSRENGNN